MGIINLTPDSFSLDGCLSSKQDSSKIALKLANVMLKAGADLLDIGGESTKPGSQRISVKEEINRVIPTIKKICKKIDKPISIDTYKTDVAKHALDAGVSIINNINGISVNKSLLSMVKRYDAAIILMHMRGKPLTMQKNIKFNDTLKDIIQDLDKSIKTCLDFGIKLDKIIVDPWNWLWKNNNT